MCQVGAHLVLKVQENQFHMKASNREIVRSNPTQGFYEIKESKKNSTPKGSMPKRRGFEATQHCNVPSKRAKIR